MELVVEHRIRLQLLGTRADQRIERLQLLIPHIGIQLDRPLLHIIQRGQQHGQQVDQRRMRPQLRLIQISRRLLNGSHLGLHLITHLDQLQEQPQLHLIQVSQRHTRPQLLIQRLLILIRRLQRHGLRHGLHLIIRLDQRHIQQLQHG